MKRKLQQFLKKEEFHSYFLQNLKARKPKTRLKSFVAFAFIIMLL